MMKAESSASPGEIDERRNRKAYFRALAGCLFLAAIPAGIDLATKGVNPSMFYVVPLLLLGKAGQERLLTPFTVLALVLTFGLWFIDHRLEIRAHPSEVLTWRLMNRAFAAFAICFVCAVLQFWLRVRKRMMLVGDIQSNPTMFDEISESLRNLMGFLVSGMLIAFIALADFTTPGQFNLPILYTVPLVIAHWLGSRRLLWLLLPMLVLVAILGYTLGEPPHVEYDRLPYIIFNRTFAICTLVVVAIFLHFLIGPQTSSPDVP